MVQDGHPVALELGVVHHPPDVHGLAGVADPRRDGQRNIVWESKKSDVTILNLRVVPLDPI